MQSRGRCGNILLEGDIKKGDTKMLMTTMFRKGYTIVIGSMWGDFTLQDIEECEDYEEDAVLESVDSATMVAYFYDANDYDD